MKAKNIGAFMGPVTPLALGYVTLFLLVACLGSWSVLTTLRGAVVASGQVVVEGRQHVVEHLDGGRLQKILVSEGDRVSAGDLLLKLDDQDVKTELSRIDRQIFEAMVRKARLTAEQHGPDKVAISTEIERMIDTSPDYEAQLEGQIRLFEARRQSLLAEQRQLEERFTKLSGQIGRARVELAATKDQLALLDESLQKKEILLGKGLITAQSVLDIRTHRAGLVAAQARADRLLISLQGEAEDTRASIQRLHASFREEVITELRDIEIKEADHREERKALLAVLERTEVRAPVDGVVNGLAVLGKGDVLQPAEPVLFLVPQDEPMVILARVADMDEPDVHTGQDVSLQFLSVDHSQAPEIVGRLEHKSADAFEDPSNGIKYFEVEISVSQAAVDLLGHRLTPGMPVEGFIRTSDRTPLSYIREPISRALKRVAID